VKLANELLYNDSRHEYLIMVGPGKAIHVPGVSELIRSSGVIPQTDYRLNPVYLARGTFIHAATELIDEGNIDIEDHTPEEWIPFVKAYRKFLSEHEVEIVQSEILVANDSLFYAGRLDRILTVDGKRYLCDYKTGLKYRWHIVQLSAYQLCTGEENLASLFLRDDGTYLLHEWTEEEAAHGRGIVDSMAQCYWFAHPRDHKLLQQIKTNDFCKAGS
jgi:hypothetical protein